MASLLDSVPGVILKIFHLCASQEVTEISYSFQYKLFSPLLKNSLTGNGSHLQHISIFYFWHNILDLFLTICELPEKLWKGLSSDLTYLYSLFCHLTALSRSRWCGVIARREIVLKSPQLEAGSEISQISKESLSLCHLPPFLSSQLFKHQTQFSIFCYLTIYIY